MAKPTAADESRPVRVEYPLEVSFAGETFMIKEFTLNLSVSGIFLLTDRHVDQRTRGTLTFHASRWSKPFTVHGEVVRTVPQPSDEDGPPAGLGIQFIQLNRAHRQQLGRMFEGVADASVVDAIRNAVSDGNSLAKELQQRPTDQKLAFATRAQTHEINALIRDGNPVVVLRLLDNPRLDPASVKLILRQPRMTPQVLIAIHRARTWLQDEETVVLFCAHARAPIAEVMKLMERLPSLRLVAIERDGNLHPRVRMKAKELLAARTPVAR